MYKFQRLLAILASVLILVALSHVLKSPGYHTVIDYVKFEQETSEELPTVQVHVEDEDISNVQLHQHKEEGNSVPQETHSKETQNTEKKLPTVVILYSQIRSGSTFVGELFNKKVGATYIYEPLWQFSDEFQDIGIQVVNDIAHCQFDRLASVYKKVFNSETFLTSFFGRLEKNIPRLCQSQNLCNSFKSEFLSRDAKLCASKNICPSSGVDTTALGKHCEKSLFLAVKVNYLTKLESLMPLIESNDVRVKIIHLVRDPRASMTSWFRAWLNGAPSVGNYREHAERICARQMNENINFILSNKNGYSDMLRAKNAYMLLRHEDIALEPRKYAEEIYKFIGQKTDPALLSWLDNATSEKNAQSLSKSSMFSTTRNAKAVINAWRENMSVKGSYVVEKICEPSFEALGYAKFTTIQDLQNLSMPSFTPCLNSSTLFQNSC